MRQRSSLIAAVVVFALCAMVPAAGAAGAKPAEQHCVLQVMAKDARTGELQTGPLTCDAASVSQLESSVPVSAVHYTNSNFTGSTLSIIGDSCSGGWLNMPSGWANVISSTASACFVVHYDNYYLSGDWQATINPGGNLTFMDNRTNSASYN